MVLALLSGGKAEGAPGSSAPGPQATKTSAGNGGPLNLLALCSVLLCLRGDVDPCKAVRGSSGVLAAWSSARHGAGPSCFNCHPSVAYPGQTCLLEADPATVAEPLWLSLRPA
jgi:hypothetical protein